MADLLSVKYGFSNNLATSVTIENSGTVDIQIQANGNPKASSAPYFYLFVPYFKNSTRLPQFNSSPAFVSYVKEGEQRTGSVTEYYIQGYGDVYSTDTPYGYYIYKVTISANSSTSSRTGSFSIKYINTITGPAYPQPPAAADATYTTKEISFTLTQEGLEDHDDPTTEGNFYYRTDTQLTNYSAPLTQYTIIKSPPASINDGYSYKSSSEPNVNIFKYLYVRSVDTAAVSLSAFSESTWARFILVHTDNSINLSVFEVQVDANPEQDSRSTILSLKSQGSSVLDLYIIQYGTSSGDDPHINPDLPTDADDAEDKYWEGAGTTGSFVITDTNEGSLIDSTQLLFKSNFANIYNTIEQKDGTLFLGNYINENSINNVHDVMNSYIGTDKILTANGVRKIDVNLSGNSDYAYIPDMTQNSQQKRVFKYGETYALGLVFVYKTGTWSSVYYLGDTKGKWFINDHNLEPGLIQDSETGRTYYNKPVRYCVLSQDVTNALSAIGIVAVIPVYAVKNSHTIMCQGFLSPTLQSYIRNTSESIDGQYSWFYRSKFAKSSSEYLPNGIDGGSDLKEIQNLDADNNSTTNYNAWMINRQICSLNTPEVEVDEVLSDAMLVNATCRSVRNYTGFKYVNNIQLNVNGKYLKSYFSSADVYRDGKAIVSITDRRVITGYFWHGFHNKGYKSSDGTLLDKANVDANYSWFAVYPWNRATVGGEGPTSQITNKRLFNSLYTSGLTINNKPFSLPAITDAAIYRDFDTASIIRVGSSVYQGNTDYIAVTEQANAYKAWTNGSRESSTEGSAAYPYAHQDDGNYAGYDTQGRITDPISIKYKTAPHIAIKFEDVAYFSDTENALFCVELLNPNMQYKTDIQDLQGYQWIKCGDLKRILPTDQTIVLFEEGDYFFGRFDSLRTYCYTEEDVNSVVEIVSGMLCSRVNLDARCDRNRGVKTPTVSPVNFNIFNPVYNQLNNYFTFSYINQGDIIYKRKYGNSIQWSLTKEYSSDVDNWCNIQDINTLDFDGDKGEIQSITKLGNNLIVFQDTGISQIQYNEKTQIATSEGIPIEIGNSNKVDGKYYLYDNIGCQYKGSISKSPSGIYFVDSINRTLYLLGLNAEIKDLCTIGGMKSWGLANLDRKWWSYYDINSQEVLFANDVEALAYSDSYQRFNAFLGYGGIRWNFRTNDRTVQICPANFTQVISTAAPNINSSVRRADITRDLENVTNTFWKKNSINDTKFFGNNSPIEIQLHCNPEPTLDKTFCVVEYRMDCFDENNAYLPDVSFDTFRAWNEYQDTLETTLKYKPNQHGPVYSKVYATRLRKKFRIWRIDVPRVYYGSTLYIPGDNQTVPNLNEIVPVETQIEAESSGKLSRDRLRNPWCNVLLKLDTSRTSSVIFNDLSIQYFK